MLSALLTSLSSYVCSASPLFFAMTSARSNPPRAPFALEHVGSRWAEPASPPEQEETLFMPARRCFQPRRFRLRVQPGTSGCWERRWGYVHWQRGALYTLNSNQAVLAFFLLGSPTGRQGLTGSCRANVRQRSKISHLYHLAFRHEIFFVDFFCFLRLDFSFNLVSKFTLELRYLESLVSWKATFFAFT